jgi:hypothetical protein
MFKKFRISNSSHFMKNHSLHLENIGNGRFMGGNDTCSLWWKLGGIENQVDPPIEPVSPAV